jgi:NAD-dependent deacetylase
MAGSKNVLELHGSIHRNYCMKCGRTWDFETIAEQVRAGSIPSCDKCGGIVKPRIVFFGEGLPEYALSEAEREARKADLMLVLGTSLTVYPAAAVPELTLQCGGKVAIINRDATHLDRYACWTARDLKKEFESLEI